MYSPQELEDRENNVVDVTEPTRFALLGVMETSRPVDRDVGRSLVDLASCEEGRSSVLSAVVVHVGKDWTVVPNVEASQDLVELSNVFRSYSARVPRISFAY